MFSSLVDSRPSVHVNAIKVALDSWYKFQTKRLLAQSRTPDTLFGLLRG